MNQCAYPEIRAPLSMYKKKLQKYCQLAEHLNSVELFGQFSQFDKQKLLKDREISLNVLIFLACIKSKNYKTKQMNQWAHLTSMYKNKLQNYCKIAEHIKSVGLLGQISKHDKRKLLNDREISLSVLKILGRY